ncbi:MAG: aspartyl protease family protein [Spirochaetaceae bacterium]|jgi:clan AA aspartic protease|nr:aspartyl protease family protein [Spirochaetaceae bacterium]
MSLVRTEITLKNAADEAIAVSGIVKDYKVRQMTLQALVDTGAWTLVINEEVRSKLGLRITGTDSGTLADGTGNHYDVAGPLEIIWQNRRTICEALVLPNASDVLLGAIPMEAMDLIVHPRKEEVVGAHGDEPLHSIKYICQ